MLNKKNRTKVISLLIVAGLLLTACGNANENNIGNNTSSNNSTIVEPVAPEVPSEDDKPEQVEPPAEEESTNEAPAIEEEVVAELTTQAMVEGMLKKVEQPMLMDVPSEMVADLYHLDSAMLEQFTIKMPMMNVKTNEIAILQVKDAKDIPTIEEAVKQRAADVQKQFEFYLQDQYENAKNYKVVVKDHYVLFVISDNADSLVNEFNSFFE